jgi:hypothetical protein
LEWSKVDFGCFGGIVNWLFYRIGLSQNLFGHETRNGRLELFLLGLNFLAIKTGSLLLKK